MASDSKYTNNIILTKQGFTNLLQNTSIVQTTASSTTDIGTGKYYHINGSMQKVPMAVVQTLNSTTTGTINYYDGTTDTTTGFVINGWPVDSSGFPTALNNNFINKTGDNEITGVNYRWHTINTYDMRNLDIDPTTLIDNYNDGEHPYLNSAIFDFMDGTITESTHHKLGFIRCGYNAKDAFDTLEFMVYKRRTDSEEGLTGASLSLKYYTSTTSTGGFDSSLKQAVWSGNFKADKVFNAVFNDYAEYRPTISAQPGQCVVDSDDGTLRITDKRLMPGAQVISDTFGHVMGETKDCKTPLAVAGRVLVYPFKDRKEYHAGMAVCTAPGGTVDIMTREEIKEYPDCIVGIVSEIPEYETWGSDNVKVDGRIWIKVK